MQKILSLNQDEATDFIDWYNNKKTRKPMRKFMGTWTPPEQWDIQRLKNLAIFSWDIETRKRTVDALASYRRSALPALTDIATTVWDQELRTYALNKIKEINETPL
jgi:hypothetical protein